MSENYDKDYYHGKKKSNYTDYDTFNARRNFGHIINFIETNSVPGNYLDYGCAFGFLIRELQPFFQETFGIDISEYAISRAREIVPGANLHVAKQEGELPYSDHFFDCITAMDVLEHTHNFEENFNTIVKKLKPGAYFIFSTPINAWPRKIFGFLDKDETHVSIMRHEDIKRMIKKAELKVVNSRTFGPLPIFGRVSSIPAQVEYITKNRE
jgi:SAM-dependent methyltransferase